MPIEPGIDIEDLASIERDQFVYFMAMEHELNDPTDWPKFREGLVNALAVAYGWDPSAEAWSQRRQHAVDVLDGARGAANPSTDWLKFRDKVWQGIRIARSD